MEVAREQIVYTGVTTTTFDIRYDCHVFKYRAVLLENVISNQINGYWREARHEGD